MLFRSVASYALFLGEQPNKEIMRTGLSLPSLSDRNHVISTIGIMGAGKSSHGNLLAEMLEYEFHDIDDEIVEQEGMTISEIFAQKGEEYFRNAEKRMLSEKFNSDAESLLSCGGGIVLNKPNRELLKQNSMVIWLYATPEAISKRIKTEKRPLLQNGNPKEILQKILEDRRDLYAHTAHVVFSTEESTKYRTAIRLQHEIMQIWKTKQ